MGPKEAFDGCRRRMVQWILEAISKMLVNENGSILLPG
jgi:hypothetical protein